MSRPKLRPLSDLLPPKGAASRPEVVSHPTVQEAETNELEIKQALPHTTMLPSLDETEQSSMLQSEQRRKQANMPASNQTLEHASMQTTEIVGHDAVEFRVGPRSAVSFRMTERLQDRLREYAHRTRRTKQDILDEALHEHLRRNGY